MTTPSPEPYLITGVRIPGEPPSIYPRLEIRELVKNRKQFTWFILGWIAIRDPNYKKPAASFVSQAGIHGLPYSRWDKKTLTA
ncbi:putative Di-copper centre containing protein, partial [Rhizoctonia solani 123E]